MTVMEDIERNQKNLKALINSAKKRGIKDTELVKAQNTIDRVANTLLNLNRELEHSIERLNTEIKLKGDK